MSAGTHPDRAWTPVPAWSRSGLARGPLRPPLPMRLQADHWCSCPPRTALELIPCGHVRPSPAYFRAGHLLLDRLADALAQPRPTQRPARSPAPASPVPGVALPVRPGRINGTTVAKDQPYT